MTTAEEDLLVPGLVLAELDYWCHERLGVGAWLVFLEDVARGAYRVEPATLADLERCVALQRQCADLRLGVVDASIVALCERLDESAWPPSTAATSRSSGRRTWTRWSCCRVSPRRRGAPCR
jgi:hypothetical protein